MRSRWEQIDPAKHGRPKRRYYRLDPNNIAAILALDPDATYERAPPCRLVRDLAVDLARAREHARDLVVFADPDFVRELALVLERDCNIVRDLACELAVDQSFEHDRVRARAMAHDLVDILDRLPRWCRRLIDPGMRTSSEEISP